MLFPCFPIREVRYIETWTVERHKDFWDEARANVFMIRWFIRIMMQTIRQIFTETFLIAFFIGSVFSTSALADLPEIDAKQVAVNADERDDGDDETAELEMILINKRGQERQRKVQVFRKDYGKDSKMVMFFMLGIVVGEQKETIFQLDIEWTLYLEPGIIKIELLNFIDVLE